MLNIIHYIYLPLFQLFLPWEMVRIWHWSGDIKYNIHKYICPFNIMQYYSLNISPLFLPWEMVRIWGSVTFPVKAPIWWSACSLSTTTFSPEWIEWTNDWMIYWMNIINEWMDGLMKERTNEMNEWINEMNGINQWKKIGSAGTYLFFTGV